MSIRYLWARSCSTRATSATGSTSARAGNDSPLSLPRTVHEATVTEGFARIRLTLYESPSVSISRRPPSDTNHTGVDTPAPSRRRLVTLRYLPEKAAVPGWPIPPTSDLGRSQTNGRIGRRAAPGSKVPAGSTTDRTRPISAGAARPLSPVRHAPGARGRRERDAPARGVERHLPRWAVFGPSSSLRGLSTLAPHAGRCDHWFGICRGRRWVGWANQGLRPSRAST